MRGSMRWRSTYREQYEQDCRKVFVQNCFEGLCLILLVAGLIQWLR